MKDNGTVVFSQYQKCIIPFCHNGTELLHVVRMGVGLWPIKAPLFIGQS